MVTLHYRLISQLFSPSIIMFSKCQKAVGKMPVYDFPELKMASSKGSFCLVKMGFQFHITRGSVSGTETMNRLSKEFQVNFSGGRLGSHLHSLAACDWTWSEPGGFCHWIICWLFSWFIRTVVWSMKCQKVSKRNLIGVFQSPRWRPQMPSFVLNTKIFRLPFCRGGKKPEKKSHI